MPSLVSRRLQTVGRYFVVIALALAFLINGTIAFAGTTGSLSGQVVDTSANNAGLAGAVVTAVSPSQTATVTTDAGGRFTIASLAPDTYTVAVSKAGYDPASVAGVSIFADQNQNLRLSTRKNLQVIGRVTARANSDLVKPGTTIDVYSVNSAQQSAAATLGGGGGLNNAYSGIASVPGVFVPQGQKGSYQSVFVRGGNYTQLGYEYDGVPIQRAFDQYPGGNLSTLGQQELQVYTGQGPVSSSSTGLAGYINQTIKTGTYPGFGTAQLGIGTPSFYHQGLIEAGGATPNRNFSYYAGFAGYNQTFTYDKGGSFANVYGSPVAILKANCGTRNPSGGCYNDGFVPNGLDIGPLFFASSTDLVDRDNTVNLHFGIPHKRDGSKDDIQFLYNTQLVQTYFNGSIADLGSYYQDYLTGAITNGGTNYPACSSTITTNCGLPISGATSTGFFFRDKNVYTGSTGTFLTPGNLGQVAFAPFPNSPGDRAANAPIPTNERQSYQQNASIVKLQYQKNFSSSAFLRLYGYTAYSDWLQYDPLGATYGAYLGGISSDYKLGSHTRGVAAQFIDQLNDKNLLNLTVGYTTSTTFRFNNSAINPSTSFVSAASRVAAVLVDSSNPGNGLCYAANTAKNTVAQVNCTSPSASRYVIPTVTGVPQLTTANATDPSVSNLGGLTCGNGPCQYLVVNNGSGATYNTVTPQFTNVSIQDTWKPSDRLTINLGLRYDDFKYRLPNTNGDLARQFYVNYYNQFYCYNPATQVVAASKTGTANSCTANGQGQQLAFSATSPNQNDYPELQPRLGATFQVNPLNVIRLSLGKTAQPASSAYQQYNTLQPNIVAGTNTLFYPFGFTSPNHTVYPEESYNLDIGWQHQAKGTDLSWSVTPYVRSTKNELSTILLDPVTNFVSQLNVGRKLVRGVEFYIRKGDLNRNGWFGQLAYTYTDAKIYFSALPGTNGQTLVSGTNIAIRGYNAFTSFCASNPNDARCGTTASGIAAAPCYLTTFDAKGNATTAPSPTCAAGSIANPYWNAPVQGLLDPGAAYPVYGTYAGGRYASGSNQSYIAPHVATLIVNYKRDRFNATPTLQFQGGARYGRTTSGLVIDPSSGCTPLPGPNSPAGDPRYPYGAPGGASYDASSCGSVITGPNLYTGNFDAYGAFREPNVLSGNIAFSYDLSSKTKVSLQLVNVFTSCYGGSNVPWAVGGKAGCNYGPTPAYGYVGNSYNPGDVIQQQVKYPYVPNFGSVFQSTTGGQANPFQAFLTATFKL